MINAQKHQATSRSAVIAAGHVISFFDLCHATDIDPRQHGICCQSDHQTAGGSFIIYCLRTKPPATNSLRTLMKQTQSCPFKHFSDSETL